MSKADLIRGARHALIACTAPIERALKRTQDDALSDHPPIFIVGAPRTGSTVLYQYLTAGFETGYINNLACAFAPNIRTGARLSRTLYQGAPHSSFRSDYGSTRESGRNAPSECGRFWYRWFPTDRDFVSAAEISPGAIDEIRSAIADLTAIQGAPVIFKNLNCGQRLQPLFKAVPEARILHIRRDEDATVASILKGRQRAGVQAGEMWSVRPPDFRVLESLPEAEMVAAQVRAIDRTIERDMKAFAPAGQHTLWFESLDLDLITTLAASLSLTARDDVTLPILNAPGGRK